MIYNKEPMQVLWDLVGILECNSLKVYKNSENEDLDSTPDSYIILRDDVANSPAKHGDGGVLTRISDCDITLVSKGTSTNSKSLHNVNLKKIKERLESCGVDYYGANLGYNKELKATQYVFSIEIETVQI